MDFYKRVKIGKWNFACSGVSWFKVRSMEVAVVPCIQIGWSVYDYDVAVWGSFKFLCFSFYGEVSYSEFY